MMKMISARFDDNLVTAIDEIAENMDVTRSEIMSDALNLYINYTLWFKKQVVEGIADLKDGQVISHDEVIKNINQMINEHK